MTLTPLNLTPRTRITSIDLLRGIVMIVMALDHTRDYFHRDAFLFEPNDLSQTSPVLFFSRWITHFCAPVFMLLTGASAYLVGERKGVKAVSRFLLTRGLFLIVMEFTVVNFGWNFKLTFTHFEFLVIWSLGVSMVALSAMVYLRRRLIFLIGAVLVAGHNLLDGIHVPGKGLGAFFWSIIHEPNDFVFAHLNITVLFPLVPWIGVIALGYCVGSLYGHNVQAAGRRKWLMRLGIGSMLAFVVLRAGNLYGDASLWSVQDRSGFTLLSFLNTSKYPPSLLYLLMTIGPALVFLALAEAPPGKAGQFVSVYGRVPMFYYLLHIYLIHLLALLVMPFCGRPFSDMFWDDFQNLGKLKGYGFSLGAVYGVWVFVVISLYPLCKWYDVYKSNHREKRWLSYL